MEKNVKEIDRICWDVCKKIVECRGNIVRSFKILIEGKCEYFEIKSKGDVE